MSQYLSQRQPPPVGGEGVQGNIVFVADPQVDMQQVVALYDVFAHSDTALLLEQITQGQSKQVLLASQELHWVITVLHEAQLCTSSLEMSCWYPPGSEQGRLVLTFTSEQRSGEGVPLFTEGLIEGIQQRCETLILESLVILFTDPATQTMMMVRKEADHPMILRAI